jgi:hypothetical protein
MYTGPTSKGDASYEWMTKTEGFLKRAFGKAAKYLKMALCPCSKCGNRRMQNQEVMGGTSAQEWVYTELHSVGAPW